MILRARCDSSGVVSECEGKCGVQSASNESKFEIVSRQLRQISGFGRGRSRGLADAAKKV